MNTFIRPRASRLAGEFLSHRTAFGRLVLPMVIFLLAGVIITAAVSTGCAIVAQSNAEGVVKLKQEEANELVGGLPIKSPPVFNFVSGTLVSFGYRERMLYSPAPWTDHRRADGTWKEISKIEAGWPLKALARRSFTVHGDETSDARTRTFIAEGNFADVASQHEESFLLPASPLWRGFLFNTLIYATIIALLIVLPMWIRNRVRLGRNRCPACGYPAGESDVCTECGRALPARLVSPAASS